MSITARQITLVQDSFARVAPIADQAAEIFYNKLFEYDPSLRKLFKGDMSEQGRKLMATLGVAVKSLTDLNSLVPVLQKLADRHIDYGVKAEDYTPVGNALLYALKQGLGDEFSPDVREAWVETFRIVSQTMKSHAY